MNIYWGAYAIHIKLTKIKEDVKEDRFIGDLDYTEHGEF